MSYFCYVYTRGSTVPHMEVVDSATLYEARTQSSRMLLDHANAIRAELYDGDRRVALISAQDADNRVDGARIGG